MRWRWARVMGGLLFGVLFGVVVLGFVVVAPVFAQVSWWQLGVESAPTNLPPGGKVRCGSWRAISVPRRWMAAANRL
jgi:hypothetical protein